MDSFDSCQSSFLKLKVSFGKLRKENVACRIRFK